MTPLTLTPILDPVAVRATGAATLSEMVIRAGARGDAVALRYPHDGGFAEVTYAELSRRARAIARGLIAIGIEAPRTRARHSPTARSAMCSRRPLTPNWWRRCSGPRLGRAI
jgi:hypothetical protein